jgi:hypothetical protein
MKVQVDFPRAAAVKSEWLHNRIHPPKPRSPEQQRPIRFTARLAVDGQRSALGLEIGIAGLAAHQESPAWTDL